MLRSSQFYIFFFSIPFAFILSGCRIPPPAAYGASFSSPPAHQVPVDVPAPSKFAATGISSLFIRNDGSFITWGGEICAPEGLTNVAQIASGLGLHHLALKQNGEVVAWACRDPHGASIVPAHLGNVTAIAKGVDRSLAVLQTGSVVVWGLESEGIHAPPEGLADVIAVAAGEHHNVALRVDGTVVAWGSDPAETAGSTRVPNGLNDVLAMAAGPDHTLALRADGSVAAWGDNRWELSTLPVGLTDQVGAVAVGAGSEYSVVALADGTVVYWGSPEVMKDFKAEFEDVVNLVAGPYHFIALKSDGNYLAEGRSYCQACITPFDLLEVKDITPDFGLIVKNDGSLVSRLKSYGEVVGDLYGVATIESSRKYYYIIQENGDLSGEGFDVDAGPAPAGRANIKMHDIISVSTHAFKSIALKADGTVAVWFGVLYPNQSYIDFPAELSDIVAVAVGAGFLALTSDGRVISWARDSYLDVPDGLDNVTAIAAGGDHYLALKADGTVTAWGENDYGQSSVPEDLTDVTAIAAGLRHSLALRADGTVIGWGSGSAPPEGLNDAIAIRAQPDPGGVAIRAGGKVAAWGWPNIPLDFYEILDELESGQF